MWLRRWTRDLGSHLGVTWKKVASDHRQLWIRHLCRRSGGVKRYSNSHDMPLLHGCLRKLSAGCGRRDVRRHIQG